MQWQQWPDWIKNALDEHFQEREKEASNLEELKELMKRQQELTDRLKQQLTQAQFELVLQWEETINHHGTIVKEWLFFAGLKGGFYLRKYVLKYL